jgi:hypothetical protein
MVGGSSDDRCYILLLLLLTKFGDYFGTHMILKRPSIEKHAQAKPPCFILL